MKYSHHQNISNKSHNKNFLFTNQTTTFITVISKNQKGHFTEKVNRFYQNIKVILLILNNNNLNNFYQVLQKLTQILMVV